MTLMPVSNIWAFGSRVSKLGAGRWMSQRSVTSIGGTSSGWPITLNTWPRVASPTGTEMPGPRLRTGGAPHEAVGRLHGDGPHPAVADLLGDLGGHHDVHAVDGDGELERVS